MHAYIYTYIHVNTYIHTYMTLYSIYMYVCMYVCMYNKDLRANCVSFKSSSPVWSLIGSQFSQKNLTNSAPNLLNSAVHRGKADEIPRLIAATQLNCHGLMKSPINRSNACYE